MIWMKAISFRALFPDKAWSNIIEYFFTQIKNIDTDLQSIF